jgi:hypothetical protein
MRASQSLAMLSVTLVASGLLLPSIGAVPRWAAIAAVPLATLAMWCWALVRAGGRSEIGRWIAIVLSAYWSAQCCLVCSIPIARYRARRMSVSF